MGGATASAQAACVAGEDGGAGCDGMEHPASASPQCPDSTTAVSTAPRISSAGALLPPWLGRPRATMQSCNALTHSTRFRRPTAAPLPPHCLATKLAMPDHVHAPPAWPAGGPAAVLHPAGRRHAGRGLERLQLASGAPRRRRLARALCAASWRRAAAVALLERGAARVLCFASLNSHRWRAGDRVCVAVPAGGLQALGFCVLVSGTLVYQRGEDESCRQDLAEALAVQVRSQLEGFCSPCFGGGLHAQRSRCARCEHEARLASGIRCAREPGGEARARC